MNRIILIGNGFDLAHGLPTKYEHFINWYWWYRIRQLKGSSQKESKDELCTLHSIYDLFNFYNNYFNEDVSGRDILYGIKQDGFLKIKFTPFFEEIHKAIETKNWVDIENEYYDLLRSTFKERVDAEELNPEILNTQLDYIRYKLAEYLNSIQGSTLPTFKLNEKIKSLMFSPVNSEDIAVEARKVFWDFAKERLHCPFDEIKELGESYEKDCSVNLQSIKTSYNEEYNQLLNKYNLTDKDLECLISDDGLLPNRTMLLNFNYTKIADLYMPKSNRIIVNHIHGELSEPDGMIFGYGDELDNDYKEMQDLNDNRYLKNVKSVRYLESDQYRRLLSFIDSAPFQIFIMGHSCGNSDRTLLSTLFEHDNCVSIKPFYYYNEEKGTDDYLDIVQNISRNFTDKKKMRDRVVNKKYCKPLPQSK